MKNPKHLHIEAINLKGKAPVTAITFYKAQMEFRLGSQPNDYQLHLGRKHNELIEYLQQELFDLRNEIERIKNPPPQIEKRK